MAVCGAVFIGQRFGTCFYSIHKRRRWALSTLVGFTWIGCSNNMHKISWRLRHRSFSRGGMLNKRVLHFQSRPSSIEPLEQWYGPPTTKIASEGAHNTIRASYEDTIQSCGTSMLHLSKRWLFWMMCPRRIKHFLPSNILFCFLSGIARIFLCSQLGSTSTRKVYYVSTRPSTSKPSPTNQVGRHF